MPTFPEKPKEETLPKEEVSSIVEPESRASESVRIQDKHVTILPLKRGWSSLFIQSALPMFTAELSAPETILKSLTDGSFAYTGFADLIVKGEIEADKYLDRATAVVLASKVPGSEKDPEKFIREQEEWLRANAYTDEMRELVKRQGEKERLAARVGERLPARFADLLNLVGVQITETTLRQLLTSLSQKLGELAGNGSSAWLKPTGSSLDSPKETPSPKKKKAVVRAERSAEPSTISLQS